MKAHDDDSLAIGFPTTRWDIVAGAAQSPGLEREEAMEYLCRIYWPAVYSYIRRKGFSPSDSEDITQDFLFRLVKGTMLVEVRQEKGRFRSFLAACCNHHLSNHRDAKQAMKRGGGIHFLSLDFNPIEVECAAGLVDGLTPEKEFTRRWVGALLSRVMELVRKDYKEDGKEAIYAALQPVLTGEPRVFPYRELAAQLGTTEANLQVMAHRLRRKFSHILKEEIKSTLTDPSELEDEIQYLISAMS